MGSSLLRHRPDHHEELPRSDQRIEQLQRRTAVLQHSESSELRSAGRQCFQSDFRNHHQYRKRTNQYFWFIPWWRRFTSVDSDQRVVVVLTLVIAQGCPGVFLRGFFFAIWNQSSTTRAVISCAGSPPTMPCATINRRASTRNFGSRMPKITAPPSAATAPMLTVMGAESLSASAPPNNAPNGAMPMNIIEYTDITRPRSSSGTMAWIRVFEDDICSIMQKPTGTSRAVES